MFSLVWFHEILTRISYLRPNPFLYIWTVLFQTIQFSISTVSMSKTVLFQTIQFSIEKQLYFKHFSSVKVRSLNVKTVLFQAIQFSIKTLFSSIWPIDRTLLGVTTPGQSGSGSDDNEYSPKLQHYWNCTMRLFSHISRTLVGCGLTLLQRSSRCILQPQTTG